MEKITAKLDKSNQMKFFHPKNFISWIVNVKDHHSIKLLPFTDFTSTYVYYLYLNVVSRSRLVGIDAPLRELRTQSVQEERYVVMRRL